MSFKGVEVPFTIPVIGLLGYPPVLSALVDLDTRMLVIVGPGKTADAGAGNNRFIGIDSLFLLDDVLYVHFSSSGPEDGGFAGPGCLT